MRANSLLPLLLLLTVAGPAAGDAAPGGKGVLAHYQGGEVRTADLEASLDGIFGEERAERICSAAYRKIYSQRALRQGLDKKPEFVAALAQARKQAAAALYRKKRQPGFAARVKETEIAEEWARRSQPGGDLYEPGLVDMDVIYLRCSVLPAERQACTARAQEIDRRLREGESFTDLVSEERKISGNANGSYSSAPLAKLSDELRELALRTPRRDLSPWLVAPHGLFRLRVLSRHGAGPRPLAEVSEQVRREIAERNLRQWEEAERFRLDKRSRAGIDEILAAAAERAGDTAGPAFRATLAAAKVRLLAELALRADHEALPSKEDLEQERQARSSELEDWVLLVFVLPAADSDAGYGRAGEIAEALTAGAAHLPATLAALPNSFPELRVEQVGPLRRRTLEELSPEIGRALAGTQVGSWRGPIPLASEGLWHLLQKPVSAGSEVPGAAAGSNGSPRSLAFVALLGATLPPLGQLREELLTPFVEELSSGGVRCRTLLGQRFGLEIMPAPDPAAGISE